MATSIHQTTSRILSPVVHPANQPRNHSASRWMPDPSSRLVPHAVAAMAMRCPDAVAVTSGTGVLTYGELDCLANRLARHLRSLGAAANIPIGLCLPRSLEKVIGALGILKSGGACVPIDPASGAEWLAAALQDAQAPVLITDSCFARDPFVRELRVPILEGTEVPGDVDHLGKVCIIGADLAYLIYPPASDGCPTAVKISHAHLANLVAGRQCGDTANTMRGAQQVFNACCAGDFYEPWPPLVTGECVHLFATNSGS